MPITSMFHFCRRIAKLKVLLLFMGLQSVIAGLWWWLPCRPEYEWQTSGPIADAWLSDSGRTLLTAHDGRPTAVWDVLDGQPLTAWDILDGQPTVSTVVLPALAAGSTVWISADDRLVAFPTHDGQQRQLHVKKLASRDHGSLPNYVRRNELIVPDCAGYPVELLADGCTLRLSDNTFLNLHTREHQPCPAKLASLLESNWQIQDWNGWQLVLAQEGEVGNTIAVWDCLAQDLLLPPQAVAGNQGGLGPIVRLDPQGNRLAVAAGRAVEIWDLRGGKKTGTLLDKGKWKLPWSFSPDGSRLYVLTATEAWWPETTSQKGEVWDISRDSACLLSYHQGGGYYFSDDGRWLVAPCAGLRCDPTSSDHWPEPARLQFRPNPGPACSADGRFLVGEPSASPYSPRWLPDWIARRLGEKQQLKVLDLGGPQAVSYFLPQPWQEPLPRYWILPRASGPQLLTLQKHGLVRVWDLPPRRANLVEYGLPALFGVLVLPIGWRLYCLLGSRTSGAAQAARDRNSSWAAGQVQP
jgi:WD40 repeat protein